MNRAAAGPRVSVTRLFVCLTVLAQSLLPAPAYARVSLGVDRVAPPAARGAARQEAEAAGLPDLEEARRRPAREPKAVPPVPSTRRRCPPRNPRCNDAVSAPGATPTPAPTPHGQGGGSPHSLASVAAPCSTAWPGAVRDGGAPLTDVPLFNFYRGAAYSLSDSPASLLPAFDYSAAPAPATPLQSQPGAVNVAAAANGAVAAASSTLDSNRPAAAAINGDRRGLRWGNDPATGSGWHDSTNNSDPDWLEVTFDGLKSVQEISVFTLQDNYQSPSEPTEAMTFSQYGVTAFQVQYWDGAQWVTVHGGSVSGNNKVWRKFTLPTPVTTQKIRVEVTGALAGYSRVTEVEAWEAPAARTNVAAAAAGATASASSTLDAGRAPSAAINGDRRGLHWGSDPSTGSGWHDATNNAFPDWLEVSFGGPKTIDEVLVFTLQDDYQSPSEPTEQMTFSQYGVTDFEVQYESAPGVFMAVPGGAVTNNIRVWRKFTFAPLTTTKIRVVVNSGGAGHSRVVEVEAYSAPAGTGLTGEYYDGDNFDAHRLTRADASVNFDWANGSPHASVGADFFSARWTGMVVPRYTETYIFYTTSDDGVRLWVDGQLVIDKWIDQGPTEWSGQLALEAGRFYSVRMEFYERWGGAAARLRWSSASQPKEVIPQSQLYGCWKDAAQFTRDFFQGALARQPSAGELQDLAGSLGQAQGDAQLVAEAQALGLHLFTSAEYAARNRADADYVSDLYWAYLQRAPDAAGHSWWTGQITACGADQQCRAARRAEVREAFAESEAFKEKVRRLCGVAAAAPDNGGAGYNFSTARLDPDNRTGGEGADPHSRNYNFQIPLVSLPGRAGLDLGLALSYNSLVWTKDATGVTFDADEGFPSPGFRLGFPVVQPKFYNPRTGKNTFLLLTPSGGRVELRQVGTSNLYESADSSYLQLVDGGAGLTLLPPDGSRLSFTLLNGSYRCYEVMDRDGNYLSAAYYGDGRLQKVTDTMGRALTFNYDANQNLVSITQPWRRDTEADPDPQQDETHTWATFGYADVTLQPQFSNLSVLGEQPGSVVPAVNMVGLDDGSYYKFSYNQWGQVWKVTHFAADSVDAQGQPNDSHPLTSTRLDLPGSDLAAASPQTDCPRFEHEKSWVEHGLMNQSGEVTVSYSPWAPDMASCDVMMPDGTLHKTLYETAGWKRGLTAESQVWSGGQKVKWTTLTWEQDVPAASYRLNPRVTETAVYGKNLADQSVSQRRTTVSYQSFTPAEGGPVALPRDVAEYDGAATAVMRTTRTEYNLAAQYTSLNGAGAGRRIIGLPSFSYVYEGTPAGGTLLSKVGYVYDDNTLPDYLKALPSPAAQHDGAGYGTSFRWRGNISRVRRYDVTGGAGSFVESRAGYHVTGTPAFTQDASGHQTSIGYADSFFKGINRTSPALQTYAYPTVLTDPDGFTSSTSYNYDMGVAREAETPKPNVTTDQPGPLRRLYYDAARRVVKSLVVDTGAYTRAVYPAKMDVVQTFALIGAGVESYAAQILDGAGRTRATARNLPGSVGGYAGQLFDLDTMGRVARQSNPTETSATGAVWAATDEAAAHGWLYTQTAYDWMGRPLVVIHPKSNPADPNEQPATREFEYGGCGCAGGEVVTLTDEVGRQRKVYSDALGRSRRTEVLNEDGTVYSTVMTKYDALDRAVRVREYAGAAPQSEPEGEGSGYRTTTMAYDGYGRLWLRHMPGQNAGASTVYRYHADDTLDTVTDGRGAVATYSYDNNRHLVSGITYTLSGSSTLTHTYTYDAAGNRKSAADGPGSGVTYNYDSLSRVTSEARTFGGLSHANSPYTLVYTYNHAGQLETLTDPFGEKFTYQHDHAGRLFKVTGTAFANVTTYADGVQYRAWGGVKAATFGDGTSQTTSYDARMRPYQYRLGSLQREDFSYYPDGRLQAVTDLDDGPGSNPPSTRHFMSRSYTYDHVGRVTYSGGSGTYRQNYAYDKFGNLTTRSGAYGYDGPWVTDTAQYTNGRRQGWDYDQDGRLIYSPAAPNAGSAARWWKYDAVGRRTKVEEAAAGGGLNHFSTSYDCDGRTIYESSWGATMPTSSYYVVRSSVLGGEVVTRLDSSGGKAITYVPTRGLVEARQSYAGGQEIMGWTHKDPAGVTERVPGTEPAAYDPLGSYAGHSTLQPPEIQTPTYYGAWSPFTNSYNFPTGCKWDGAPADCDSVQRAKRNTAKDGTTNLPWTETSGPSLPQAGTGGQWVPRYGQACTSVSGDPSICEPYVTGYEWRDSAGSSTGVDPQDSGKPSMDPGKASGGCMTANLLISRYKDQFMEPLWNQTTKSGEENGLWFFVEPAVNTMHINQIPEGRHFLGAPSMPDIGPQTREQFQNFRAQGRRVVLLALFHTHPNYPSGDSRSGNLSGWGDEQLQFDYNIPLMIIRTGSGYTFVKANQPYNTYRFGDAKGNECIQFRPSQIR